MCFAKNSICKRFFTVVVVFLMKYPKYSFVLFLFCLLTFYTWPFQRGVCNSHRSQVIYPIFHFESPVSDIHNGSTDALQSLLQQSSISFVMYYSHWCAQSAKLVYKFHRASKKFEGQVSFIAINCWTGSCHQQNFLPSYPRLFLHHTNFEPIEYRGRRKYIDLVYFVQKSIRPLTYISSQGILEDFLHQGHPCLLGFFNATNYKDKYYNEFFGAALHTVNTVSTLQLGVITSSLIASLLGLKKFGQVILVNALKTHEVYPQELNYNWTTLSNWAESKKIEYVEELAPDKTAAKSFKSMITNQPSLILFIPLYIMKTEDMKVLHSFHQVAISYHNCSCSGSEDDLYLLKSSTSSLDNFMTKYISSCQSLLVDTHRNQNICEVCHKCCQSCSCSDSLFPLQLVPMWRSFTLPHNSCRSLRGNTYQDREALSVCCSDESALKLSGRMVLSPKEEALGEPVESFRREKHLKIIAEKFDKWSKEVENDPSKNESLDDLLSNLIKILKRTNTSELPGTNSSSYLRNDSVSPEYHEYGSCRQRGKVRVLAGAGCHSNNTLKFYFMDSGKYWKYALGFGVRQDLQAQVALVLVDTKNEAQYVLSEETQINNKSIVDFVMNFTNGNLTRRLRSAPVPHQSCSAHPGCLTEVVSKTFSELVLDDNKDVFLMYSTPWCGFCKSVKPALISLVDHYRHCEHIRIARLNADLNDLPWEFTVESYPTFIFFPAKRKHLSVKFPENEERTLGNFVKFVEAHRTLQVNQRYVTRRDHVRIDNMKRRLNDLKRQNVELRMRLSREVIAKQKAEERLLIAERQINAIVDNDLRAKFDLNGELRKLTLQNSELLDAILNAQEQLTKYRKVAERTVNELRQRNLELQATILSVASEENLLSSDHVKT